MGRMDVLYAPRARKGREEAKKKILEQDEANDELMARLVDYYFEMQCNGEGMGMKKVTP